MERLNGDWARVQFWVGGYLYVLFFLIYKNFLCFVVCCIFNEKGNKKLLKKKQTNLVLSVRFLKVRIKENMWWYYEKTPSIADYSVNIIFKDCSTFVFFFKYVKKRIKSILIHKYQHKSTRANTSLTRINTSLIWVNTNQYESDTSQHKSDKSQHESDNNQYKSTRV